MNESEDFIKGATFAYNDVAEFFGNLAQNFPKEFEEQGLWFVKLTYADMALAMRKKAEILKLLLSNEGAKQ